MLKRIFDLTLIAISIPLILPFFLLTLVLVKIKFGMPIFFFQMRPGCLSKPFILIKFRTMTNERNSEGIFLNDDQRLTTFGKFLRSTSFDELPSLWNVIKGEMSLVGPRPLLMEYLPLYNARQAKRHDVKPGITGWAQVNGRNAISWQEKFDLDVWYVENQSFWLDLKILLMTVKKVIMRDGISGGGEVTMSKFIGNNK
jgi:lipopolysaccharide/colanic/teichoic acid biosynthesis glycosyltransferase